MPQATKATEKSAAFVLFRVLNYLCAVTTHKNDMEIDFIIRLLVASILGAFIGLDREYRTKAAGFRTHFLVALGSALFMIISVHGFDYLPKDQMTLRMDPARIAAQVVTGIGFIGAGTILLNKNVIRGLTTAAGLWVTAAIGMACGVGMYALASVCTILVIICFEAFNGPLKKMREKQTQQPNNENETEEDIEE